MIDWGDTALRPAPSPSPARAPRRNRTAPARAVVHPAPPPDTERRLLHFSQGRWDVQDGDAASGAGLVHAAAPDLLPTAAALAELIMGRLYRFQTLDDQCAAMKRDGIAATRILLAGWINQAAERLQPLVGLIADEGRRAAVLAAANMSFGQCHGQNRRLWLFDASGDASAARPPMLWIRLTPDRLGSYAAQELEGFNGRLQAQSLSGYDRVASANGQALIGCWSIVRAQAEELAAQAPHAALDDLLQAAFRLRLIEARIANAGPEAALAERQREAKPVVEALALRLAAHRRVVYPASSLGGLLQDLDASWPSLTLFLEDGRIALENNATLRLRKMLAPENRWVFGRRQDSRNSAVTLYSLAESCLANGVEPSDYLAWALSRLRTEKSAQSLQNLLPWRFHETFPAGFAPDLCGCASSEVNYR